MDWKTVQQNWPELSGSILTRWPEADEEDVLALDGDYQAFVAYIAGLEILPAEEAADRVEEWAATAMPADARMAPTMADEAISDSRADLPAGEEPLDADEAFGDEAQDRRNLPEPPVGRSTD